MYKVCMALGWSVIRMQLLSAYLVEHIDLWNKISQHRFIFSDKIDEYYSENAEKEGLLCEYKDFISSVLASDQYLEIRDDFNDMSRNISDYLKNKCKGISLVICENGELNITKSACRNQYTIEEAAEDERGPFAIYSVTAAFYVDSDESASVYIEWIKNLISAEKEINIIDHYVLEEERNYRCLIDYYFPIIPRGCKVNLHVTQNAKYLDQVLEDARDANVNIEILTYYEMKHERYITTGDRIINIGLGIDFMCQKLGKTLMRKGSNFSLRKKDKKLKHLEEEIALAGRPTFSVW